VSLNLVKVISGAGSSQVKVISRAGSSQVKVITTTGYVLGRFKVISVEECVRCVKFEGALSRVTNLEAAWTVDTRMTGCWRAPFCRQLRGKSKEFNGAGVEPFQLNAAICSNFSRKCVYLFHFFIACASRKFVH
jgi:hypothetical protein